MEVQLDGEGVVILPELLAEKGIRKWENTLVGVVLGCRIPFVVVERNVRRMWQICGITEVINVGASKVFIRFSDDKCFEPIHKKGD